MAPRKPFRRLVLPPVALALAWGPLGCSSSPSESTSDGGGDASTFSVAWDWVGIVGTGQSLSVGGNAPSVTATQQRYNNLKLSFGGATVAPPFDPTIASLAMVPLVEPIRCSKRRPSLGSRPRRARPTASARSS